MLWVKNAEADAKILRMLWNYAKAQRPDLTGIVRYDRDLLEFTGMLPQEFERWCKRGVVSDRNLRCMDIPFNRDEIVEL